MKLMTINDFFIAYSPEIDRFDLELLIAHELEKSREFVLAHPEYKIPSFKIKKLKLKISRRRRAEPLAYILGHKEFYGLDFKVNKNTLIPRPETELLIELAIQETSAKHQETNIIDIGTGSGNIIISLAKLLEERKRKKETNLFGIDIDGKALRVAKYNSRKHGMDKKINLLKGNLLSPILKNKKLLIHNSKFIILANLPYLSKKIYDSAAVDVHKYEPRSALLSGNHGLAHYKKLLIQIKKLYTMRYALCVFMEISPEQKPLLRKLIKERFPATKIEFHKDLAGKWRVCKIMR